MPKLEIDVEARIAKVQDAFEQINRNAERTATSVQTAFSRVGTVAITGAAAAAAAALTQQFGTLVKGLADLDDAAEKAGSSVENLSGVFYALKSGGVSLDQITDAASKLVRSMQGADDETKGAAQAFKALGVETKDAAGNIRDSIDVLKDVAKGLDGYADGANKVAIAQALFGKSGSELLPLLKDLAKAQDTSAKVTSEQAAEAEKLSKAWRQLAIDSELIKVSILSGIIPSLSKLIEQFRLGKEAAGGFFGALLRYGVMAAPQDPADAIKERLARITELNAEIERQSAIVGSAAGGTFGGGARNAAKARIETLRGEVQQATKDLQYFRLLEEQLRGSTNLRSNALYDAEGTKPQAPRIADKPKTTGQDPNEQLQKEIQALLKRAIAVDENLRIEAELFELRAKFAGANEGLFGQAEAVIRLIDERKKQVEAEKAITKENERQADLEAKIWEGTSLLTPEMQRQVEHMRRFREELGRTATAERERNFAFAEFVNHMAESGEITRTVADEMLASVFKLKEETSEAKTEASALGEAFRSSFEKAILEGESLSDVLKGLAKDVASIYLRQQITAPAADALGKVFGGGGSSTLFSLLSGFFTGGSGVTEGDYGQSVFQQMDAADIVAGTAAKSAAAASGGVSVTQNINVGAGASYAEVSAAMKVSQAQTIQAIRQSQIRGGVFA